MNTEQQIFKRGSTTYYWSSKFFPKNVRRDVFDLYSFLRVADDYVDQMPADEQGFLRLRQRYEQSVRGPKFDTTKHANDTSDQRVVKNMTRVSRKYDFELSWTTAFLDAMQSDLAKQQRQTIDDTLAYMYGSAEVIGLMMSRIMGLESEAEPAAMMQGRAMQLINFIRDIEEDNQLGRQYFPEDELKRFGLPDLSRQTALANPANFTKFIHFQIGRYRKWQAEAEKGYKYIPKRTLTPIKTAADMYSWTARKIEKDPAIIYTKKVRPTKKRAACLLLTNMF